MMRIFAFLVTLLLATLISLVSLSVARAQSVLPMLKPIVEVSSEIVTLGDLFSDAGLHAEKAVFRSPDLNRSGKVSARQVAGAARAAGMENFDIAGIDEVEVHRKAILIGQADIETFLEMAVRERLQLGSEIEFEFRHMRPVPTEPADPAAEHPISFSTLAINKTGLNNQYEVISKISVQQGTREKPIYVLAFVRLMGQALALKQPKRRGEMLMPEDLITVRVPFSGDNLQAGFPTESQLIGMAVARPMAANRAIGFGDIVEPDLVRRNEPVRIVLRSGRLTITADGRALENGGKGSTISVLNAQSKRVIEAEIVGNGVVSVGPALLN